MSHIINKIFRLFSPVNQHVHQPVANFYLLSDAQQVAFNQFMSLFFLQPPAVDENKVDVNRFHSLDKQNNKL